MLSELSLSPKPTCFMIPFMSNVQNRQIQVAGCWQPGEKRDWRVSLDAYVCLG